MAVNFPTGWAKFKLRTLNFTSPFIRGKKIYCHMRFLFFGPYTFDFIKFKKKMLAISFFACVMRSRIMWCGNSHTQKNIKKK